MAIVGAVLVGGYLLLKPKTAAAGPYIADTNGLPVGATSGPTTGARTGAEHFGAVRATAGARAQSAAGATGAESLLNKVASSANAKNAAAMGQIGNKVIPGSGPVFEAIGLRVGQSTTAVLTKGASVAGSVAASAIKKLKFW